MPAAAYTLTDDGMASASLLTRGPWDPAHQHAGPPTALCCRAVEQLAAAHGLDHVARLTVNLMRPVPVGVVRVEAEPVHIGRRAGHFVARLLADGRESLRLTALVLRAIDLPVPPGTDGHPLPSAPVSVAEAHPVAMPFKRAGEPGYAHLVENRSGDGRIFAGPCAVWFRLTAPLVLGETPSPYQRVMVAADSGNGVSAVLDIRDHRFVNADLTVNLIRRPLGDWVCLDARTALGGNGAGLAESALYDEHGLIGRATQTLVIQPRDVT